MEISASCGICDSYLYVKDQNLYDCKSIYDGWKAIHDKCVLESDIEEEEQLKESEVNNG